jgi:origin recognition complex subunit 3
VSSLARLLSRLNDQLTSAKEGGVVVLESGDAPNLKTTLKNIIRAAITNTEGNDGYQTFLTDREVRLFKLWSLVMHDIDTCRARGFLDTISTS